MAKKKQPDFQPTKLRVGKHLPKGRNVTNTSFKAKKIITKDQRMKTSSKEASLTELIRLAHNVNVNSKTDALNRIRKYMLKNVETLPAYFSEILKATGKLFLDLHHRVRREALKLIKIASDNLSDAQMSAFTNVLTSHLNCMMTHINLSVRMDSLHLLSHLLKAHPNTMCRSTKCLSYLLNMISSVKVQKGESAVNQKKRKLDDNISTTMTSVEWRDQVMKIIAEFLDKLVESYAKQKQPCLDEQKVYYDGIKPLSIQLYAGGGLTPAKMDFSFNQKSKGDVTDELRTFFSDILCVASDIVTEEVAGLSVVSGSKILRPDNVDHLNTVTEVLCHIADWYNMDSQPEDMNLILEMNEILSKKLMKGFCYKMQETKKRKNREMSCVYLNLGISSLYCFFCLGRVFESAAAKREILLLVVDVVNQEQYQDVKTTSFILKILKCFFRVLADSVGEAQNVYREEFTAIMAHLCDMAARCKDRALTEAIQTFFIELSLDYDYKFLLDGEVLDAWIIYAFKLIEQMHIEQKADKSMLKCISLMCSREYSVFMEQLNEANPFEFLSCLTLNDEDYQMTVINLITHKTNLPPNFLQAVTKFILEQLHFDGEVSEKILLRLIRALYNRFSDERVGLEAMGEFFRFVLNVAFDVMSVERAVDRFKVHCGGYSGDDEQASQEEYPYDLMQLLYNTQSRFNYTIVPSHQWKKHSKISEACIECLILCQDRRLATKVISCFFHEMLKCRRIFPVHSVISLLNIVTDDYWPRTNELATFIINVTTSCLLYISIVTNKQSPEQCKEMSVGVLQSAMKLNADISFHCLSILIDALYHPDQQQTSLILYSLRIIIFLTTKKLIDIKDVLAFEQLYKNVEDYFSEDSVERAYLCKIYSFLQ